MKRAQERIASGCDTTIVTETDPVIHRPGVLERAMRGAGIASSRYDLLTTPRLRDLLDTDDPTVFNLLVGDILAAVSLHGNETVLVAARGDAGPYVEKLSAHSDIRKAGVKVTGCDLAAYAPDVSRFSALVVSCMDYGLHGERGGLYAALKPIVGPSYALLVVPGGARDLNGVETPRSELFESQIANFLKRQPLFRSVLILSHTDCGKYGGDGAFKGREAQFDRLRQDLRTAADYLLAVNAGREVRLKIRTGIAVLRTGTGRCVASILPVE